MEHFQYAIWGDGATRGGREYILAVYLSLLFLEDFHRILPDGPNQPDGTACLLCQLPQPLKDGPHLVGLVHIHAVPRYTWMVSAKPSSTVW